MKEKCIKYTADKKHVTKYPLLDETLKLYTDGFEYCRKFVQ